MKIKTTIRGGAVNATATLGGVRFPRYGGRGCGGVGGYPILVRTGVA